MFGLRVNLLRREYMEASKVRENRNCTVDQVG